MNARPTVLAYFLFLQMKSTSTQLKSNLMQRLRILTELLLHNLSPADDGLAKAIYNRERTRHQVTEIMSLSYLDVKN